MEKQVREVAKKVMGSYNPSETYVTPKDNEGAVILPPQIVRAFPISSLNCIYGAHQAHLNGWINGRRKYLQIYNGQEANALRPLYALDQAKEILNGLERFSIGESEGFSVDSDDNGFATVYIDNFSDVNATLEKLDRISREQARSKIKTLAELAGDSRQGFYWPNLPQDIIDSGKIFEEIRGMGYARNRNGMGGFLTENPNIFRKYFDGLVSFVNANSKFLKDIESRDLSKYPLLSKVDDERTLKSGDYLQGQFFVPGEGWMMLDGEFSGLTSLDLEGKKRQAIKLGNYSTRADELRDDEITVYSDTAESGNPVWRLK